MQALPTPYAIVNALLEELLLGMQAILSDKLVGLYLYGSLVTGDFDLDWSDIDLLAATSSYLDGQELERLHTMHDEFAHRHKAWDDRIEVAYLSVAALKSYKLHSSTIAIISPGEPFHTKEAGKDWLINWYVVREKGIALFGPSPKFLLDPISKEEYLQMVQKHMSDWREWISHTYTRGSQAYAILTMCRALYSLKNGEIASKKHAAAWAEKQLPEWSTFIRQALLWRETSRNEQIDHAATLPETQRFVSYMIDLCENISINARPDTLN